MLEYLYYITKLFNILFKVQNKSTFYQDWQTSSKISTNLRILSNSSPV